MERISLLPYDEAALKTIIYDTVRTALDNHEHKSQEADSVPPPDDQRIHGDLALSKYLDCTVQTINRLKMAGKIPAHRYGRKYYYLRSEIDAAFKVKTASGRSL